MAKLSMNEPKRLDMNAGIAIGPILFIIAVLGILASAIAAGSGSFTTSTTGESNRAKASAIIDMGQNLKLGFERVVGVGNEFSAVVIDELETATSVDLFSPLGGGISAPSVTMAAAPASDVWHYPHIAIPRLGTAAGSRVAVLRVSEGVCDEINNRVNAMAAGVAAGAAANIGDFSAAALNDGSTWPAPFAGKPVGCVNNTNAVTIPAGFYFYQVMGVQ